MKKVAQNSLKQEISPITGRIRGLNINSENTWSVVIKRTGEVIARFRSYGSAYNFKVQHNKDYFRDLEVRKCTSEEEK